MSDQPENSAVVSGKIGPRLGALLSDAGVSHEGSSHRAPRTPLPPGSSLRQPGSVVSVIVETTGQSVEGLDDVGLRDAAGSAGIVTGSIRLENVPALAAYPAVTSVELSAPSLSDIHTSVPATKADTVRTGPLSLTGKGVVVGVLDSGIDIFHHAFRKANGDTRIIALRDGTQPYRLHATGTPTDGKFVLEWTPPHGKPEAGNKQKTAEILFNAKADAVRAAFENATSAINPGDVVVTGGPLPGADIEITFAGRLARTDMGPIALTTTGLKPATADITVVSGKNYTKDDINAALVGSPDDFGVWDSEGHGTHVTGIAAGDGSQAGNCHLSGYFIGVAPEADIVFVKRRGEGQTLDGIQFIIDTVKSLLAPVKPGPPAVINMSFGFENGARNGTHSVERKIDTLLAGDPPGLAFVKSAGNNGGLHDYSVEPQTFKSGTSTHSKKTASGTVTMTAKVFPGDNEDDWFYFWYFGTARLTLTVKSPIDATTTPAVAANAPIARPVLHGHKFYIRSRVNVPNTNGHNIAVRISPPAGGEVRTGDWVFTLRETTGHATDVHCWIDSEARDQHPRFVAADHNRDSTLTPPATAHCVIAVANYDHRENEIAQKSSRGPTIDMRAGMDTKPDLAAPGQGIWAAKSSGKNDGICCDCCGYDFYTSMDGTSMAAPHITGIIALMLQHKPTLTWRDIRDILRRSADPPDPITGPMLPDATWGAGIVNAAEAVAAITASADGVPIMATGQGSAVGIQAVAAPVGVYIAQDAPSAAEWGALRRAVLQTPAGQLGFALVSTHLSECLRLVNNERRVTVAWHHMGGPALVRSVLDTPRDGPPHLPKVFEGRDVAEGLAGFLDALQNAGSLPLRTDIERYRSVLLTLPGLDLEALGSIDVAG
jgi:subtilisin family serine protease